MKNEWTYPLSWIRSRLVLTSEDPPTPITYSALLVAYVALASLAALLAAVVSWRPIPDPTTLIVGAIGVVSMSVFAVRTVSGVHVVWSASGCLHLGMTLALGPSGAIVAALSHAIIGHSILKSGWFRVVFNGSIYTLTSLGAWWTTYGFGHPFPVSAAPLVGLTAGGVAWIIDYLLLSGVISIASKGEVSVISSLRSNLGVLPHTVAYGWAAAGTTILYRQIGLAGFSMLLVPIVSAQVFLVLLARRTQQHESELRLAETEERRRIARDLHDTVVQTVAGTALTLSARAQAEPTESSGNDEVLRDVMRESAEQLRSAARDLRTLIIQIAPPTLMSGGLRAALQPLAQALMDAGTAVEFDLPGEPTVDATELELIFRVAQEALRNTLAHADARHISVSLREEGGQIRMSVADDGKGFNPVGVERRRQEGHVGTRGIAEASARLGGTLTIDAAPGDGTSLSLVLPKHGR